MWSRSTVKTSLTALPYTVSRLRADHAHEVTALPGNVDPVRNREDGIRFRFPFPDEDTKAPGDFDDPFRGVTLWGVKAPEGVEHGSVQFKADNGYLVSLPCPEGPAEAPYTVHRNGYGGATKLVQQRYFGGRLVTVCECSGCGHKWRLPELADAKPVIDALHDEASGMVRRHGSDAIADRYRLIASRVEAGYKIKSEVHS